MKTKKPPRAENLDTEIARKLDDVMNGVSSGKMSAQDARNSLREIDHKLKLLKEQLLR
jgi:hypothetical protein